MPQEAYGRSMQQRVDGTRARAVDDTGAAAPTPLAGNLLVTKSDRLGELIDVTENIEAVAPLFTIIRPVLRPVIEVSERPGVIAAEIVRVEIILDRSAPKIGETAEG